MICAPSCLQVTEKLEINEHKKGVQARQIAFLHDDRRLNLESVTQFPLHSIQRKLF